MYKDFIHIFVLSCHKATYLLEKHRHIKLSFKELLQLKIHLSLCGYCAGYAKEADFIDSAIRKIAEQNNYASGKGFSDEELQRIRERILSEIMNNGIEEK